MAAKAIGTKKSKAHDERREKIHRDYWRRHPERARAEKALRQDHKAAQRDFGHKKHGTVETLQKASRVRQGSLARLYEAGNLTADQLAASQEIRVVAQRVGADVKIGTVSLETRVDQSGKFGGAFFERLGAVRAEVAYGHWRRELGDDALPVLAMIVHDAALTVVAKTYGMRKETARRMLCRALDDWREHIKDACDAIDEAELLAAQAGLF